jgi:transposase-like protein
MTITLDITCPHLTRNGKKNNHKQNYRCKDCGRQFISSHELTYRGCLPEIVSLVNIMLVRGIGIRDISTVLRISITKVLKVLTSAVYHIKPRFSPYDCLEIDEFWTYVEKRRTTYGLSMRITGKAGRS